MATIDDTLSKLDVDTIINFLEREHHCIVLAPVDVFKERDHALNIESRIVVEDPGHGVPDMLLVFTGHEETVMNILKLVTTLRMRRIDP